MKKYHKTFKPYEKLKFKARNRVAIIALVVVYTSTFAVLTAVKQFTALVGDITIAPVNAYMVSTISPACGSISVEENLWVELDIYNLTLQEKIKAVSIVNCESRFDLLAIGVNKNGTKDLGLWQINDIHKLDRACAFDLECATNWAVNKYHKDGNWSAWVCAK